MLKYVSPSPPRVKTVMSISNFLLYSLPLQTAQVEEVGKKSLALNIRSFTAACSLLAAQTDEDFVPVNETARIVTFSRNDLRLRKCLRVTIVDDYSVEKIESFSISLERFGNLDERIRISPDRGTVTIEDDDGECNICN